MDCETLTNDILLAPTVDASRHVAECERCRERQKTVQLMARALRAMSDDEASMPEGNSAAVLAAIPAAAADARRHRPATWWTSIAAAAALLLAVGGGWKWASTRDQERLNGPGAGLIASQNQPVDPTPGGTGPSGGGTEVPDDGGGGTVIPPTPLPVRPVAARSPIAGEPLPPLPPEPAPPTDVVRPPDPIKLPPDPVKPPPEPAVVVLTAADPQRIMRGIVGEDSPAKLDLNGDGITDVADALLAARAVANNGGRR